MQVAMTVKNGSGKPRGRIVDPRKSRFGDKPFKVEYHLESDSIVEPKCSMVAYGKDGIEAIKRLKRWAKKNWPQYTLKMDLMRDLKT